VNDPNIRKTRSIDASDQRFLVYWHFWIGVFITPILLLMSLTGGILLFEDELQSVIYPSLFGDTTSVQQSLADDSGLEDLDRILPIIENKLGPDTIVWRVELENRKRKLPSVLVAPKSKPWPQQRYYVNLKTSELFPNPESVQASAPGGQKDNDLFESTTLFHRTLYMGWFGRLLVEFTATWLIASTLLGILLWYRSRSARVAKPVSSDAGNWYLAIKKLHSTAGIVSALAIVTIAWNGLHYSEIYGTLYHGLARATGQYDYLLDVPKGKQAGQVDLTPLKLGDALQSANKHGLSWQRISVQRLPASTAALMIESGGDFPPSMTQTLYLDAEDLSLLARYDYSDLGWLARWNKWSYSLHTGSFGGLWTKILWLIVLVLLAFLPISASVMTLARRRKYLIATGGKISLDKILPQRAIPEHRWVWVAVGVVAVLFPVTGLLWLSLGLSTWLLEPIRSRSPRL